MAKKKFDLRLLWCGKEIGNGSIEMDTEPSSLPSHKVGERELMFFFERAVNDHTNIRLHVSEVD